MYSRTYRPIERGDVMKIRWSDLRFVLLWAGIISMAITNIAQTSRIKDLEREVHQLQDEVQQVQIVHEMNARYEQQIKATTETLDKLTKAIGTLQKQD